jgi:hypothetical protein
VCVGGLYGKLDPVLYRDEVDSGLSAGGGSSRR